jgi:hypothetical protein
MSKASELLAKLQQTNENVEAIQQYWTSLFPDLPSLSTITIRAWLQRYDFDTVVAGLDAAVLQASKRLDGKPMNQGQVVNYASATMRDVVFNQMTPDEKAHISKIRSEAAKKRWNKARISKDLRPVVSVCSDLHTAYACSDSSSPADATASACADALPSVAAAATPPVASPSGVSQKQKPENLDRGVPPNKANKKTAKDGTPFPSDFDSWSNNDRLIWLTKHDKKHRLQTFDDLDDEGYLKGVQPL